MIPERGNQFSQKIMHKPAKVLLRKARLTHSDVSMIGYPQLAAAAHRSPDGAKRNLELLCCGRETRIALRFIRATLAATKTGPSVGLGRSDA
jgi:hypothetical protein